MNSRTSVSSRSAPRSSSGGGAIARSALSATTTRFAPPPRQSRCARGRSCRRDATWISQPRGLSGTPSTGHCVAAAMQRLLHGVLGGGEVAEPPRRPRRAPAARARAAGARPVRVDRHASQLDGRRAHHLAHLDRHVERRAARRPAPPTRAPRSRRRARRCRRPRSSSPARNSLASGNGPSVTSGAPPLPARTTSRLLRRGQPLGRRPARPTSVSSWSKPLHEPDVGLEVLGRPAAPRPSHRSPRRVHHQHVLHRRCPWLWCCFRPFHGLVGAGRQFSTCPRLH